MKLHTLLLVAFTTLFLSGCFKYEDIELKEVKNVELKSIKDNNLDLEIEIELYNPNSYKVKVSKADLDVHINTLYLGHSKLSETIEIPAEASSKKVVKLTTELSDEFNKELPGLLTQALFSGLKLKVDGKITGKAKWLSHTFDIHHEEKLNLNDLNIPNL